MNQSAKSSAKETLDLPTLFTVICHLMTLYAIRPCEPLAMNIQRHIKVVLNFSETDALGEWQGSFQQLLTQWETIADRHAKHQLKTVTAQAKQSVSH